MGMTTAARDRVAGLIIADGGAVWGPAVTNAYLGVGDSSAAFVNTQTDLQAAANKLRKQMDASYPQRPGNVNILTFRSTFTSAEANFAWNEFGTFTASSAGTMLQRVAGAALLGTKASGQTWELTVTCTLNVS